MSRRRVRSLRAALAGAVLALVACASPQPKPPALAPPPPPLDASYDWHVLLIVAFGSVLKDVPATLHEVLLFRDEARGAAPADELECYAVDSKPPRFIARAPAEYLLCFKQDRLSRIEATVRLPAEEAVKIFADACGLWAKNGQAAAEGCAGSDRGIEFSGHLDSEPTGSDTAMTVQLDAADGAPEHAPERR
jgi:hypothetical protein